ncbi:MAG TPA: hypothetical protein VHX62_17820 [Solirubrobacteraceae bacterium]|jgi:hypothetical protein|nr:hypothetical protein [Solirubrobacteraceae bacterium]
MATRAQVMALLDSGHSVETAARRLDLAPGLVYMIATGRPADDSDSPHPDELRGRPVLPGGAQHLVNPPAQNPTRNQEVIDWVRERAARELRGSG